LKGDILGPHEHKNTRAVEEELSEDYLSGAADGRSMRYGTELVFEESDFEVLTNSTA
jgi:hypothetical protein